MGVIYIIEPVLIQSDDNPTFLAVYRVEERIPWESADGRCRDLIGEAASLLDPSDQKMFNVSVFKTLELYVFLHDMATNHHRPMESF